MNKNFQPFWISLRNKWPEIEKESYHIWDARYDVMGKAFYNGWDFLDIEWDTPITGSLMLRTYIITHWAWPLHDWTESTNS